VGLMIPVRAIGDARVFRPVWRIELASPRWPD
jgi:hypothetical protein